MAKSKAQVLTLIQEVTRFRDDARTWLSGTFTTDYNLVATAISAGDDEPEDAEIEDALKEVELKGQELFQAVSAVCFSIHKTMGRYAGAKTLDDPIRNLNKFHDKLTDDSEAVESHGRTKFTSLSSSGGSGTGVSPIAGSDPDSIVLDIAHIETISLICDRAAGHDGVAGQEQFRVEGNAEIDLNWDDPTSGDGEFLYAPDYRNRVNGFSEKVQNANRLRSVDGGSPLNKLKTGDFEAIPGNSQWGRWSLDSGSMPTRETTNQYKGDGCLNAQANFQLSQSLVGKLKPLAPHAMSFMVRVNAALSAGDITLLIQDDSTTHKSLTIDGSTLTNDTWTRIPTTINNATFNTPNGYDQNLKAILKLENLAGASAEVLVDETVCREAEMLDGGYAVSLIGGDVDWAYGQTLSASTTSTAGGTTQRMINEVFGTWLKHAGTAVYWADYS